MLYVGLDVHQRTSSYCILEASGQIVKEATVFGDWDVLLEELARIRRPWAVCFEASCGYGVLYDRLTKLAQRVMVAHPGHLRLIYRSRRKNDRIDARKLAKLLLLDEVPTVWVPTSAVRKWRELIEYRCRLVGKRTRCKNGLKSMLRGCGIQKIVASLPRTTEGMKTTLTGAEDAPSPAPDPALYPRKLSGQRWWAKGGLQTLAALPLPMPIDALRRDQFLAELHQLEAQIKQVVQTLDDIADDHPGVALLRTIPGVGPRTAEATIAYVDDPHRFQRNKQIGAYAGLVPCQDASADKNRLGHITKEGPGTLRWLLVESAWQAVRHSPTIRAYYERIIQGRKDRRRIALVATAHHLLRVMLAMLKSGEVWRESVAIQETSAATAQPTPQPNSVRTNNKKRRIRRSSPATV